METKIYKIEPNVPENKVLEETSKIIRSGGIVAFPTETVYGLGADATDPTAAKKIYSAKGRPSDNPLIVHISDMDMLRSVTTGDLTRAKILAEKFWPGPLTLILNKSEVIPFETTGGLSTVAVRMPERIFARLLIQESGLPIAAPSANTSGRPSPTTASHVIEDFNGRIDAIVDDGPSTIGIESTILDLTGESPVILRQGFIERADIEKALGIEIKEDPTLSPEDRPKAPGMKYRHYAPRCDLYIVRNTDDWEARARALIAGHIEKKEVVAFISCEESRDAALNAKFYSLGHRGDYKAIMQNLYAVLRKLDADDIKVAYCEDFSMTEHGEAIAERLLKASGNKVV